MFPFTLRQLEVFERACRAGSFRTAAEQLNISQPAVSRQMAALESQLGFSLFARNTGHSCHLTLEGRAFLDGLEEMLSAGRKLAAMRRPGNQAARKKIRLHIALHLMQDAVRPRMLELLELTKGYELNFISDGPRMSTARQLEKHNIDLAIFSVPAGELQMTVPGCKNLGSVASGIYGHTSWFREGLTQAEVARMPFVLPPSGTEDEERTLSFIARGLGSMPQNPVIWSAQIETIRKIVAEGHAVGYMLESMIMPFSDNVICLLEGERWTRYFYRAPSFDPQMAAVLESFLIDCLIDLDKGKKKGAV